MTASIRAFERILQRGKILLNLHRMKGFRADPGVVKYAGKADSGWHTFEPRDPPSGAALGRLRSPKPPTSTGNAKS
jgi:hypothetical protein